MSEKKKYTVVPVLVFIGDAVAVTAAFLAAFHLRFFSSLIPVFKGIPEHGPYLRVLVVLLPVFLWTFRSYRLYSRQISKNRMDEVFLIVKGASMAIFILMALSFVYREVSFSRLVFFFTWLLAVLFVSFSRTGIRALEGIWRRARREHLRILLVGINRYSREVMEWYRRNASHEVEVIGILADNADEIGKHVESVPIVGTVRDLDESIERLSADEVILTDPEMPRSKVEELVLISESHMVPFRVVADFYGTMTRCVDVEYVSGIPLLGLKSLPLDDVWNRILKRLFDIGLSLFGIIITFPLWILSAVLIKLDDGGAVFYKQERVGLDGKAFRFYKFRSMQQNAEKTTGPVWANENDERRTRAGTFLRGKNLDELPQLWNVLKGDMSLVGPRPERPYFVERFKGEIPRYMARHKIKTGITGWAQVNGLRGNTSLIERIKYDLHYMENWSILFDLKILLRTFFNYKNAY